MSKFDLRDISERLANSSDTEAVVFEFIGYLQSVQPDWRASLAFYEVSQDALINVYNVFKRKGMDFIMFANAFDEGGVVHTFHIDPFHQGRIYIL